MKFCYNCGFKLSDEDLFCCDCGADMRDVDVDNNSDNRENLDLNTNECDQPIHKGLLSLEGIRVLNNKKSIKKDNDYYKKGVIVTNTVLLSKKLSVNENELLELIELYIELLETLGLKYRLVNFRNFTRSNKWYDYHKTLLDVPMGERKRGEQESEYLYIIGGNDIIPVPVINNYIDNGDSDIETDILYAYPYGIDVQRLLESTEIYRSEMLFMVSRLPLASDATFENLCDFMQRTIINHAQGGVIVERMYGQSDPHWSGVSKRVVEGLNLNGLVARYSSPIPEEIFNGRLFLTPPISAENISQVFDKDASFYYFNLHGGNQPDLSCYVGQVYPKGSEYVPGFFTDAIRAAQNDNIFVAECCYGAKYVGYDIEHSMLNSALMSSTLLFLGSSRIAYGLVDGEMNQIRRPLISADLICAAFIDGLLSGLSSGESLTYARYLFFTGENNPYGGAESNLSPQDALTLCEFNLYGDPMLGMYGDYDNQGKNLAEEFKISSENYIAPKNMELGMTLEKVVPEKESLLNRVRGAVDANINALSERIGRDLYTQFGLSPREPKQIIKVKYKNGDKEYCFLYEDDNKAVKTQYFAVSDRNGELKSVVTSK